MTIGAAPPPPAEKRLVWALIAGAVVVRLAYFRATGVTYEDSFISLRYAENLVRGHGLVYNVGEAVFGASTPLYVLLLAGLDWLGVHPATAAARAFTIAADAGTLWLWSRLLRRATGSARPGLVFGVLFGLSPFFVEAAVSGMETSLALFLASAAVYADTRERPWLTGILLGLLCLTRPDGLLIAALVLGCRLWRTRRLPWRSTLMLAAWLAPWTVFATLFYGTPLPHSIPAKVAAYNLHGEGRWLVNLSYALFHFAPWHGSLAQLGFNAALYLGFLIGIGRGWSLAGPWRLLTAWFLVWLAYLTIPGTLLFLWYLPMLILPVYVLSGLGWGQWLEEAVRSKGRRRGWAWAPLAAMALGALIWLPVAARHAARTQAAEATVRRPLGEWLARESPPDALVALEPIGYIGYYSQRRILDEVGLVSPAMVPLTRRGDGWFSDMLRRFAPDYLVQRPYFLAANSTLNSQTRLFRNPEEQLEFALRYRPVRGFRSDDLPNRLLPAYRFVVFRRRSPAETAALRERAETWSWATRREWVSRLLTGEALPAPPPQRAPRPDAGL